MRSIARRRPLVHFAFGAYVQVRAGETASSIEGSAAALEKSMSAIQSASQPSLYLVGTPIGNLEDISLRALRILKEVDLIACEDTRQTAKLLNHYGIETRTISYHQHNELTRAAELIMHLEQGKSIALVTDAGMPGVSDPGFRLVSLAIRHKVPVVPIPGASAFLSALVASGLPTDSFVFHGFLPSKLGQRRKLLEEIQHSPWTQIFYEAPHRLLGTLEDIAEVMGAAAPRGGGARGHQDLRRVCARHGRRGAGGFQEAR